MNDKNDENLKGIDFLMVAKNQMGQFVLADLDESIQEIIKAIRKAPNKGGSLNIHMTFEPHSEDGEIIGVTAKITNVKKPQIPPKTELAFATKDGKITNKNPQQVEVFGDDPKTKIDKSTGEVLSIAGNKSKPNKIK